MNKNNFVDETLVFSKKLDLELIKEFHVFEDLSSTNNKAKELVKNNVSEGTIVISKTQSNGRGRFDRIWISPEGGIYFSIILKPKCRSEKTTIFPLLASVCICETIKSICDLDVKIKWPNDVLVNGKKISGILLESESKKNDLNYVIFGIGFNLNIDIDIFPKEFYATSLSYEIGINLDYYDFLKKLLTNFDNYYTIFKKGDYKKILKIWRKNSDTIGREVMIKTKKEEKTGKAVDIDDNGFLITVDKSGNKTKITSGDCFHIK